MIPVFFLREFHMKKTDWKALRKEIYPKISKESGEKYAEDLTCLSCEKVRLLSRPRS